MMVNRWTDREAAFHLATRLQGPALKVLGSMPVGSYLSYAELTTKLAQRFGPGKHPENYLLELRMRRRRTNETLQELGQEIRDLTAMAYPELPREVRERLAKGHFLDAINDSEIRAGIFRSRPATLDDAIRAALETECFLQTEQSREKIRPNRYTRNLAGTEKMTEEMSACARGLNEVRATLAELMGTVKSLQKNQLRNNGQETSDPSKQQNLTNRDIICFVCGKAGHIARQCAARGIEQPQKVQLNSHRPAQRVERWPRSQNDPATQGSKTSSK